MPLAALADPQKSVTNHETEERLTTAAVLCLWANPQWCLRTLTRMLTEECEGWTAGEGKSCSPPAAPCAHSPSLWQQRALLRDILDWRAWIPSVSSCVRRTCLWLACCLAPSSARCDSSFLFSPPFCPFYSTWSPPLNSGSLIFFVSTQPFTLVLLLCPLFCCLLSRLPDRHSIVSDFFFPFSKKKLKNLCTFVPAGDSLLGCKKKKKTAEFQRSDDRSRGERTKRK